MTAFASRHPAQWYLTTAASIAVGVVPIWVLETWFGVPRKISVGYGILSFAVGTVALKVPFHHFVIERTLRARLAVPPLAVTHGLVSGLSELGAAAAFLAYVVPKLTWWQLVGFGVGAGAAEAIMLPFISNPLKGTALEGHAEDVYRASAGKAAVQWLSVLERVWAMLLQVSTRALVGLSVYRGNPTPACIALLAFGVCDGSAYYWHLRKWRFDSLPVLLRVHLFIGVVACLLTATFLWWSTRLPVAAG